LGAFARGTATYLAQPSSESVPQQKQFLPTIAGEFAREIGDSVTRKRKRKRLQLSGRGKKSSAINNIKKSRIDNLQV
jgi:hypothetical protein